MSGRAETFLIEPDRWGFEPEEVRVNEERLRGLLIGPDPQLTDHEAALAIIELLHAELTEMAAEDYGVLSSDQIALAFSSLYATASRLGLTQVPSRPTP